VHGLTAVDTTTGELAAILTISMPTLNGPWRHHAWPRLFHPAATPSTKRLAAQHANRYLRTISRVIVDPRYRALGIARRLVEAYLADPLTPCTEAIASMGRWCPFFAHAGMRDVPLPPTRRERMFARALERLGLEPWELADVGRAASVVRASESFRAAITTWANYSRATRRQLPADGDPVAITNLAILAGASLTARPVVYVNAPLA
jgi:hypothetical protein